LPSRNTVKSTRRNHVSVFDEQITTDGFCVNSTENMKFEHAQVLSNPQDDLVKNTNKRFLLISVDKYLVGLCPTGVSFDKIDNLIFMRQYLGLTGLITFLFYWPMLVLPIDKEGDIQLYIHLILSNLLSISQNTLYFFMITIKSPYFIQTSGLILQPSIVLIEMLRKMQYFTNRLIGFCTIFGTLLFIG
ncbi:putative transporter, partial [Pseudoloma neurophilia]